MSPLSVALGQMASIDDLATNLQQIRRHCERAAAGKAQILFLPENALYLRIVEGQKVEGLPLTHPVFAELQRWSESFKLALHLGLVPLLSETQMFNASVFLEPGQAPQVTYKKIHLFDISLENQKPIRESDIFEHGTSHEVLQTRGWSLGQSICYDLRFAELYLEYAKRGVDAILVPSAFLVTTGQKHWEALLRARAIESQCYVLAAAQAGTHVSLDKGARRETYGHSLVVDPWGEILVKGSADREETLFAELSHERIQQVRRQIPMRSHRRL